MTRGRTQFIFSLAGFAAASTLSLELTNAGPDGNPNASSIGIMLPEPLIDLQAIRPEGFHPSKMDIGPDRKIYFNNSVDNTTYRVDEYGTLEAVATYGDGRECPFMFPGFLLGLQFDDRGNMYAVNLCGLWKVPADDIPPDGNGANVEDAFDASNNRFFPIREPAVPQGLGIRGRDAYIADMVGGKIYKVDLRTGQPGAGADADGVWADNDRYPLLGKPDSNNFLTGFVTCPNGRCGFGSVEPMPGPKGRWLYYTNHEDNAIYRIRIRKSGRAGVVQKIDAVEPFALNGAYLDPIEKVIYAGSPFTNFPQGFDGAFPAGTIFVLDRLKRNAKIRPLALMLLKDDLPAVPVDAISGRKFGSGNRRNLYVLDGSFDTLMWPPSENDAVARAKGPCRDSDHPTESTLSDAPGAVMHHATGGPHATRPETRAGPSPYRTTSHVPISKTPKPKTREGSSNRGRSTSKPW